MRKFNYLFFIFLFGIFPKCVFASSNVNLSCSSEALVGNRVVCIVGLESTDTILGATMEYEYSDVLTYEKTTLNSNVFTLANSSRGFTVVNEVGFQKTDKIAIISFLISNKA